MSEPPSSTGLPMTAEELRLFYSQLIAFAIDMHATCSVRRCRRKKRCLVPGATRAFAVTGGWRRTASRVWSGMRAIDPVFRPVSENQPAG